MGTGPSINYAQEVHVAKAQTDPAYYTSIQSAIDAITDNAAGKRYAVIVHPGSYSEKVIMEDYIDLIAAGGREETIITFTATAHGEPTLTGENSIIKGFTIISDGDTGTFRTRAVDAGTAGFEMEDCVCTVQNSAGASDVAVNASASCDIRDCVIDDAGISVTGARFTTGAQTYNVLRTTFNGATDAVQVTTAITALNLEDCTVSNNFNQDAGTVVVVRGQLEAVALGTAACTFTAELARFTGVFSTADAFGHTITCYKSSFSGQNLNNAATGATTINLRACDGIDTLTNAGVGGTLNLYECGVETLTTTQGTVVAYGGRINACGGSTGTSFVWWHNTNELKVLATMLVADALGEANAGDTVKLGQGTFAESNLTAVNGVDIVGEDQDISIIEATDNANPIITVGNGVTCVFTQVKISNLGTSATIAIAANASAASLTTRSCVLKSDAANEIVTLTTAGVGAPSYTSTLDIFDTTSAAVAVSGAVAATTIISKALFASCTLALSSTAGNHVFLCDLCDFATAGVSLFNNAPVVTLTRCDDIGTFSHATASTVTMRVCYVSGVYTCGAGGVASVVNAVTTQFTTLANSGSGAITLEECSGTDLSNQLSTMTIEGGHWDTVMQNVAAGTINIYGSVIATELDCGAGGAINAYDCQVTDIDCNGGAITLYAGDLRDVSDVTGAVVWWSAPHQLKVVNTSTPMLISHALAAASAGDTIRIGPGTFTETVTFDAAADVVTLIGEGRDKTIITQAAAGVILVENCGTLAGPVCIENLTITVTAGAGVHAVDVHSNTADASLRLRNVTVSMVGTAATANYAITTRTTANLSYLDATDVEALASNTDGGVSSTYGFNMDGAGASTLRNCISTVVDTNGSAYAIYVDATAVTSYSNVYSSTGTTDQAVRLTSNAGSILLCYGDTFPAGTISKGALGTMTYKTAMQQYEVWSGMEIGDAITAAAADSPAPAAASPYTVLVHPGVYAEVITPADYINLKGVNRDSCIVQQDDATILTLDDNSVFESLTFNLNSPTGAQSMIVDGGTAATGNIMRDCAFTMTVSNHAHRVLSLTAASTLTMEGCSCNIDNSANNSAIVILLNATAAATVQIIGGDYNLLDTAGSILSVAIASAEYTVRNCRLAGTASHLTASAGIIRVSNSQYRSVTRTATGDIVDESPESKSLAFHVVKMPIETLDNLATRTAVGGAVTLGGSGQARLRINDNAVDAAGIENNADAAGALDSSFTAGRTPRYVRQISVNAFRATTDMFFGLRATPGAAVPGVGEDHFGFDWDGANFRAISSDGAGVGEQTNLVTPSTGAQHELEAIQFSTKVEFRVDGVLVATHSTAAGIPTVAGNLDFQDYEISDGGGGATTSDATLRNGFVQECPA